MDYDLTSRSCWDFYILDNSWIPLKSCNLKRSWGGKRKTRKWQNIAREITVSITQWQQLSLRFCFCVSFRPQVTEELEEIITGSYRRAVRQRGKANQTKEGMEGWGGSCQTSMWENGANVCLFCPCDSQDTTPCEGGGVVGSCWGEMMTLKLKYLHQSKGTATEAGVMPWLISARSQMGKPKGQ